MKIKIIGLVVLSFFLLATTSASSVYVDDDWFGLDVGTEVIVPEAITGEEKTYVIGNGAFGTIQEAINKIERPDSKTNNIYVYPGLYEENIVISKPINIWAGDNYETIIKGASRTEPAVSIIKSSSVFFSSFKIIDSGGILLEDTYDCKIRNCVIEDNSKGIYIFGGNYNTIPSNRIENNDKGIVLEDTSENIISNNLFINNDKNAKIIGSCEDNIWYHASFEYGNYWSDWEENIPLSVLLIIFPNLIKYKFFSYKINNDNTDLYPLLRPNFVDY